MSKKQQSQGRYMVEWFNRQGLIRQEFYRSREKAKERIRKLDKGNYPAELYINVGTP